MGLNRNTSFLAHKGKSGPPSIYNLWTPWALIKYTLPGLALTVGTSEELTSQQDWDTKPPGFMGLFVKCKRVL